MILMEDYLAIMKDYHYARFAKYCGTCIQCMGGGQIVAYQASGEGKRRRLADDDAAGDDAANDDAAGDDAANDDAAGGDAVNDDAAGDDAVNDDAAGDDVAATDDDFDYNAQNNDDLYGHDDYVDLSLCQYEDQCANYEEVCQYHHYHGADYENFMECTEYALNDDQVVYLGPHCSNDGHSITIGLFEDQYCSSYLGDVGTFEEIAGFNINENSLAFFYSPTCIPCAEKV
jgi:hypothetical protein